MEALEAILSRRSIRHFTGKPVPQETVRKLLEAGMSAPSACDFQPWQLVVINDRTLLDQIPAFHNHAAFLPEAPMAILVCGEPGVSRYWQQDCAAAAQNILLAAHSLGLGAVWLGLFPRDNRVIPMRGLLGIPEDVTPMALIAIGYPAEQKPPLSKFQAEKVHYNRWHPEKDDKTP
jgi:nitroreductase